LAWFWSHRWLRAIYRWQQIVLHRRSDLWRPRCRRSVIPWPAGGARWCRRQPWPR